MIRTRDLIIIVMVVGILAIIYGCSLGTRDDAETNINTAPIEGNAWRLAIENRS